MKRKMSKDDYIILISSSGSRYGDTLLELMDKYDKPNLKEITLDEAKEFWKELENDSKRNV